MTEQPRLPTPEDLARLLGRVFVEHGPIEFTAQNEPLRGMIPVVEPIGPGRWRFSYVPEDQLPPSVHRDLMLEMIQNAVSRPGKSNVLTSLGELMESMDHTGHDCAMDPTREQQSQTGRAYMLSADEMAERAARAERLGEARKRPQRFEPKFVGDQDVPTWVPPQVEG